MTKLAVVLLAFGTLALSTTHGRSAEPLPSFAPVDLAGHPFEVANLAGKVVVLDFWASWCAPCRQSFPFLDGLQSRYGDHGLVVLGVTLEDDLEPISRFLDGMPVHFKILRDPTHAAGESFGVVAMPTTFLIDRHGRIAARFEGSDEPTRVKLEWAVKALLADETLPAGTDVRVSTQLEATGTLKAWERGYLADPIMNLDGDPLTRLLKEHVHASKEGAAGDGGAAGGGCGCN